MKKAIMIFGVLMFVSILAQATKNDGRIGQSETIIIVIQTKKPQTPPKYSLPGQVPQQAITIPLWCKEEKPLWKLLQVWENWNK